MVNFFFEEMRKYQIISQNKELQIIKKNQINKIYNLLDI